MTPANWLLAERLDRAKQLLEIASASVENVALAAGFGSVASLRTQFRAVLGLSPSDYRLRLAYGPSVEPNHAAFKNAECL